MTQDSVRYQFLECRGHCVKNQPATFCEIWWLGTLPVYTVACLQQFMEAVWRLPMNLLCFHKTN